MLSVLLRYTDSDYPFGIFKFFLFLKRAVRTILDLRYLLLLLIIIKNTY